MSEDRLVDIEVKLAHQDQLLIDLNSIVTDQQSKITQLEELVASLIDRVRSIGESASESQQDERPPHY